MNSSELITGYREYSRIKEELEETPMSYSEYCKGMDTYALTEEDRPEQTSREAQGRLCSFDEGWE